MLSTKRLKDQKSKELEGETNKDLAWSCEEKDMLDCGALETLALYMVKDPIDLLYIWPAKDIEWNLRRSTIYLRIPKSMDLDKI